MKKLIQKQFGLISLEIKKLWGYENSNYLIKTKDEKFVFKTYLNNSETLSFVKAENEALLFLKSSNDNQFPNPIRFKDGSLIKIIEIEGKERICRMLSYLEGELLGNVKPTKTLHESIGKFVAELDLKLRSFNNNIIKARKSQWDIQYLHLNKKYINDVTNAKNRTLVRYFFQQFEENVTRIFPELRNSIIHGDANEWNILVNNGKVTGIIDFNDLSYTPLINELAITIAYACLYTDNILESASVIIESYHKVLALEEKEITILYYLIAARLCISVCNAANSKKEKPGNEYAFISEKSAWRMLYKLLAINPTGAENCFRKAIGLPAVKSMSTGKMYI